jgi:hypothetical protein
LIHPDTILASSLVSVELLSAMPLLVPCYHVY